VNRDSHEDAATPAEERLLDRLDELRRHPPEPAEDLGARVVRAARWQGALRPYALAAGALAASIADGGRVAMGVRR
jgi:hypothetical protein